MKQKKRRHFNNARGGRSTSSPITLFIQRVPQERFDALSEQDRYCLLLLGHVHDELSWLQRTAYACAQRGGRGNGLEQQADMMQTTLLLRLLLGKLFEFKQVMESERGTIQPFIIANYRPDDQGAGAERVETIFKSYADEAWLRIARNKHFLHYPTLADVRTTLGDANVQWELEIAHGAKSSNTFYPTSDAFANYAWIRRVNPDEPMKGLDEALDVLTKLAKLTMGTLEESIGHFVDANLMRLSDNEPLTMFAPSIRDLRLSYFIATQGE